MSTNSVIGLRENGSIRAIYCHWDGYPDSVGSVLNAHYTSVSKLKKLLALGSLSSLGERLAPKEDEIHTFEKPADGVTVAYHRDRGEELQKAKKVKETQMNKLNWGAYAYILDVETNQWFTFKCTGVSEDYKERSWQKIDIDYAPLIEKAIQEYGMKPPNSRK